MQMLTPEGNQRIVQPVPPAPPDPARGCDVAPERRTIGRMAHQLPSLSKSRSSSKTWASPSVVTNRGIAFFFGTIINNLIRKIVKIVTKFGKSSCSSATAKGSRCAIIASSSQVAPCAILRPISQLHLAPLSSDLPPAARRMLHHFRE